MRNDATLSLTPLFPPLQLFIIIFQLEAAWLLINAPPGLLVVQGAGPLVTSHEG